MFNPKLYCELCETLTASQEKVQEVIQMTQQKKGSRRPVRVLAVAAAATAALAVGASAAGREAVQELFVTWNSIFVTGECTQGSFAAVSLPTVHVEEREGRAILVLEGEETDITDALEAEGAYTCRLDKEDSFFEVTVDREKAVHVAGYDGKGQRLFSVQTEPGGAEGSAVYTVTGEEDGDGGFRTITVTAAEDGMVTDR